MTRRRRGPARLTLFLCLALTHTRTVKPLNAWAVLGESFSGSPHFLFIFFPVHFIICNQAVMYEKH